MGAVAIGMWFSVMVLFLAGQTPIIPLAFAVGVSTIYIIRQIGAKP